MNKLTAYDLSLCVSRLPKDVRNQLTFNNIGFICVGGGFIRSTICGEKTNDVDLFGSTEALLDQIATKLALDRKGNIHRSKNAITVLSPAKTPIQLITRWLYDNAEKLCSEFDFTVCQAVIWWNFDAKEWDSCCSPRFYSDLAARRLHYTFPKRTEDAGGSIMRVRKFLQRGYKIQAMSLAGVIAQMMSKIEPSKLASDTEGLTAVIAGLLHEVDPLVVIDGVDFVDEHEILVEDK